MTKKNRHIILGVIFLTLSMHPRVNHLLTQPFQPKTLYGSDLTAPQLWEIREFYSVGSFSEVGEWPTAMTDSFPSLSSLPFSIALAYTSDTIQSIDFMVSQDHLDRLSSIIDNPLPSNRTISLTQANQTWVIGVFDAATALKVNGYFSDIIEGDYWVHIGTKIN